MKNVEFHVKEVSDQINSNFDAWAKIISTHNNESAALVAAQKHWEELCDAADECGSSYIGKSVYIKMARATTRLQQTNQSDSK